MDEDREFQLYCDRCCCALELGADTQRASLLDCDQADSRAARHGQSTGAGDCPANAREQDGL